MVRESPAKKIVRRVAQKTDAFEMELKKDHFRVVIFGSARIKEGSRIYKRIYRLAKRIGEEGLDVVTGGGLGLMDAAMSGHFEGKKKNGKGHEIGLQIKLPWENHDSRHFDVKHEFSKFSERLDTFMMLANCIVVAPGGIGTLLELAYSWQLMQVHHAQKMPIILLGNEWREFANWVRIGPLKHKLLDKDNFELLILAENVDDAMEHVLAAYKEYVLQGGKSE